MPAKKLRVMLSSRCDDVFPADGGRLSELRRELKAMLEAERLLGTQLYEVWINEDAPPADVSGDSLATCLAQIDEADIVIALSNGNAGWAPAASDIGICHAELQQGASRSPAKVRLIALTPRIDDGADPDQTARDARFKAYLGTQNYFRGGSVKTVEQAKTRVREAVFDATVALAGLGLREARKGQFSMGEALAWSSLNFSERQRQIVDLLSDVFAERGGTRGDGVVQLVVNAVPVVFAIHAIPAALSVAAAREMVGRPFLADHRIATPTGAAGPVHVIGCHKGATEAQATALLGFPDATIVSAPFGIYVADPVQKVQFMFLKDCRDPNATRFAAQRMFDWLAQSGEDQNLVTRAQARARIVAAIRSEARPVACSSPVVDQSWDRRPGPAG